jgi:hypothetical protein
MSEPPTETSDSPRVVAVRTFLLALTATAILSIGAAVALSYALIGEPEPGPPGPVGEQGEPGLPGERGRRGPAGNVELDEDAVWDVVEGDPQRITDVVEEYLSPTPSDVDARVDDVASDLSSLCTNLSFSDALSEELILCP